MRVLDEKASSGDLAALENILDNVILLMGLAKGTESARPVPFGVEKMPGLYQTSGLSGGGTDRYPEKEYFGILL